MKNKWLVVLMIIGAAMLLVAGCSKENGKSVPQSAKQSPNNAPLTVKVLDIGQGDAILIRAAGQIVLVDTGDIGTKDKLVDYIKKEGITTIDKVIITHPHADHLGGMTGILENFKVSQIYDSGQTTTTALYRKYLSLVQKKGIPFTILTAGAEIPISDEIKFKVLAPEKPFITEGSELNNNSVVAKLIYRNFSMLLTGDAEKESEERMLKTYKAELKSSLLKVGHHGSNTSSSAAFLKAVAPEAAFISLGANNDYHHPHPSTLKRYEEAQVKVYRTDISGTVTIASDGKAYTITKER